MSRALFTYLQTVMTAASLVGGLALLDGCKKGTDQGTTNTSGSGSGAAKTAPAGPKATALAFSRALSAGDVAAAKALSTGDVAPATLDTLAKLASATTKLQKALKAKFGEPATRLEIFTESPDPEDELNRSKEEITGDTAVISLSPTDKNPTNLKKINGEWKMDITKFKEVEPMFPQLEKMAAAWNELAADVSAGKFATLDDFKKAYTAKTQASAGG